MRYFLISFTAANFFGSVWFSSQRFPTHAFIISETKQLVRDKKFTEISDSEFVILNIFEFKSEEDYNNFIREV